MRMYRMLTADAYHPLMTCLLLYCCCLPPLPADYLLIKTTYYILTTGFQYVTPYPSTKPKAFYEAPEPGIIGWETRTKEISCLPSFSRTKENVLVGKQRPPGRHKNEVLLLTYLFFLVGKCSRIILLLTYLAWLGGLMHAYLSGVRTKYYFLPSIAISGFEENKYRVGSWS